MQDSCNPCIQSTCQHPEISEQKNFESMSDTEIRPPSRKTNTREGLQSYSGQSPRNFSESFHHLEGLAGSVNAISCILNEIPQPSYSDMAKVETLIQNRQSLESQLSENRHIRAEKLKEVRLLKIKNEDSQRELDRLVRSKLSGNHSESLADSVTNLRVEIRQLKLRLSNGMNELILRTNGEFVL